MLSMCRSVKDPFGVQTSYKLTKYIEKSAYESSGPSGWSLSQFPWHEVTRNISTPPGWDASPSQGYPKH